MWGGLFSPLLLLGGIGFLCHIEGAGAQPPQYEPTCLFQPCNLVLLSYSVPQFLHLPLGVLSVLTLKAWSSSPARLEQRTWVSARCVYKA